MKKWIVIFGLLIVPGLVSSMDTNSVKVRQLIKSSIQENRGEIISLSSTLNYDDQMSLYKDLKKTSVPMFLVNLLVPIPGLGSIIQGDTLGIKTTYIGVGSGGGVALLGYLIFRRSSYSSSPDSSKSVDFGYYTMIAGGSIAGVFFLYGLIKPFIYASHYNRDLKKLLSIPEESITFLPKIDMDDNSLNYRLCFEYSF